MLRSPESYEQGAQVRIYELEDCEHCVVYLSSPIESNEIILKLYDLLPKNYDGMTGMRNISFTDLINMFRVFRIQRRWWEDYYQRMMYFHDCLYEAVTKEHDKKSLAENKIKGQAETA